MLLLLYGLPQLLEHSGHAQILLELKDFCTSLALALLQALKLLENKHKVFFELLLRTERIGKFSKRSLSLLEQVGVLVH